MQGSWDNEPCFIHCHLGHSSGRGLGAFHECSAGHFSSHCNRCPNAHWGRVSNHGHSNISSGSSELWGAVGEQVAAVVAVAAGWRASRMIGERVVGNRDMAMGKKVGER